MQSAVESVSYMDRRLTETSLGVSSAYSGGVTTWTLPYSVATDGTQGTLAVALRDSPMLLVSTRPAANQIAVAGGDYRTRPVFIGVLYTSLFVLSTIYVRKRTGEPDSANKLTLRRLSVLFEEATEIVTTVRRSGGKTSRASKIFPRANYGEWKVPIHAVNEFVRIEVSSPNPGGFALKGFTWEGDTHPRAQQV